MHVSRTGTYDSVTFRVGVADFGWPGGNNGSSRAPFWYQFRPTFSVRLLAKACRLLVCWIGILLRISSPKESVEQRAHSEALHPRWPGKASRDVFRGLSRALQQILRTLCPTKHIATQLSGTWIGVAGEQRRNRWFRKLLPSKLSQFAAYGRLERSALWSVVFICKICERLIVKACQDL